MLESREYRAALEAWGAFDDTVALRAKERDVEHRRTFVPEGRSRLWWEMLNGAIRA